MYIFLHHSPCFIIQNIHSYFYTPLPSIYFIRPSSLVDIRDSFLMLWIAEVLSETLDDDYEYEIVSGDEEVLSAGK